MSQNLEIANSASAFDGRLPPPTFAAIETTMFCNLKCHFCIQFQDGTTVRGPHMDEETFEKVSDVLFPHLERFQPSVSGEPLMSKGLDRVLAKAEQHGLRAEYYCNGTLLNERMAKLILPTLGRLNVSFDGATRETFEALRRGADYDKVLTNVRRIVAMVSELPDEERPPIGFACTLMEQNVRELPRLVDMAADLGLDFLACAHVLPGNEEVAGESLFHHQDLAREHISAAFDRARERRLPFSVQQLDNLISGLAEKDDVGSPHARLAGTDGVQAGVPSGEVNQERMRGWPKGKGKAKGAGEEGNKDRVRAKGGPDEVWTCEYLWDKLYVSHGGSVAPCCVPGVPTLGNLKVDSLEDIWNGDVQRSMRLGLAMREPAPCCKGCQHIREVKDSDEIHELLRGQQLPEELPPLPPVLRPIVDAAAVLECPGRESVDAPRLEWESNPGAEAYEVEISLDGFRTWIFRSAWHDIHLREAVFEIPDWAWALAPMEQSMEWRALALFPSERVVVARGMVRKSPASDGA